MASIVGLVVMTIASAINISIQKPNAAVSNPIQITIVGESETKTSPEYQATVYSASWCVPCQTYLKAIQKDLPPDGWIVKDDTDKDALTAHVIVTKSETEWKKLKIEKIPTTIIRRNGKEVKRLEGAITTEQLTDTINKLAEEKK